MHVTETLIRYAKENEARLADTKAKFDANYQVSGAEYALRWSDKLFAVGAANAVWQHVAEMIGAGHDAERLLAEAEKQLVLGAQSPESSTSAVSNVVARYRTAAWAEVYQLIKGTY